MNPIYKCLIRKSLEEKIIDIITEERMNQLDTLHIFAFKFPFAKLNTLSSQLQSSKFKQ